MSSKIGQTFMSKHTLLSTMCKRGVKEPLSWALAGEEIAEKPYSLCEGESVFKICAAHIWSLNLVLPDIHWPDWLAIPQVGVGVSFASRSIICHHSKRWWEKKYFFKKKQHLK